MDENPMFCYQCEQTAGGKGCTKMGVCGKTPEIANLQDLLVYQCKGISAYAVDLIEKGEIIDKSIVSFVENSLFTTLTNVNFDAEVHVEMLKESQKIKEALREKASNNKEYPEQATYNLSSTKEEMLEDSVRAGIMFDQTLDADIRSLRQTIIYGLKGISAYGHQARFLGYFDDQVDNFYFRGLECTTNDNLSVEEMIRMTMRTGDMSVAVMKKLDEANTNTYKNPTVHKVNVKREKGPFIIVS
ncbi:MAG: hydroxylamine reductase, partial [Clostridium sp.]|nr:hydroxylamine reductase [Clostridium sp.]